MIDVEKAAQPEAKGGSAWLPVICCYSSNAESKIVWQITDRCHLSCNYCFTPSRRVRDLSLQQALNLLDILHEKFPMRRRLLIAGREPLIFRGIEEVIEKASGIGFRCSMSTTGELLTAKSLRNLLDSGLAKLNFTLNSVTREHHELNRAGSRHSRVINAIQLALGSEVAVRVNITVTSNQPELVDGVIRLLVGMGVSDISISLLHPYGPQPLSSTDYERATKDAADQYEYWNNRVKLRVVVPPKQACYEDPRCPAKKGLVSVLPNGHITGCNIFPDAFDRYRGEQ